MLIIIAKEIDLIIYRFLLYLTSVILFHFSIIHIFSPHWKDNISQHLLIFLKPRFLHIFYHLPIRISPSHVYDPLNIAVKLLCYINSRLLQYIFDHRAIKCNQVHSFCYFSIIRSKFVHLARSIFQILLNYFH